MGGASGRRRIPPPLPPVSLSISGRMGCAQAMYELYGPATAGKMLTALGRLFIKYIQFRGFTCRIDDLLLTVRTGLPIPTRSSLNR